METAAASSTTSKTSDSKNFNFGSFDSQRNEDMLGIHELTDHLSNQLIIKSEGMNPETLCITENGGTEMNEKVFFAHARHGGYDLHDDDEGHDAHHGKDGLVSKWRQKDRLKTTSVALVMCLNIGVDPPDVIKISPCARLECWVDPLSMQAPKALDTIGKNLQAQYERWQPRAKYRMHLDPTTEDVKKLAISCRRSAKSERVLFHYNGHGVPRPTANGEIWVFNKSYTQYIPLSIYDLQTWVGTPAIYIFDCSVAGQIVVSFKQFMAQRMQELEQYTPPSAGNALPPGASSPDDRTRDPMRDCILLAACGENELLPQNPDFPADVFTSCLTTPIKVALRWFCSRSLLRDEGITKELIDRIPGKQTDRKTPLGELNWIFTAITDTIAWNILPRTLFQKLFRQDLLVASLFRNFLLAERIMRSAGCTPVSYPRLPPMHQHPMWDAWDMAAEMCLLQLPELLTNEGTTEHKPSNFFAEQLTAFELWLEHGGRTKEPPEQLPIVLQVLLSQVHRLRALILLGRFLDMGVWAVDLALSVGIFPYVLKLLQTTAVDLRQTLVFIWAKILAWDANAQVQGDLVKDNGHLYFIKHLESQDVSVGPDSRAQAAFVLACICNHHSKGQMVCAQAGLLQICSAQLPATLAATAAVKNDDPLGYQSMIGLTKWIILCLGKLCEDIPEITALMFNETTHELILKLLASEEPEIRAAAAFCLGSLIQVFQPDPQSGTAGQDIPKSSGVLSDNERLPLERAVICGLFEVVYDGSPNVRCEVARALGRAAVGHAVFFQDAVHAHQKTSAAILRSSNAVESSKSAPSERGPIASKISGVEDESGKVSSSLGKITGNQDSDGVSSSPGVRLREDLDSIAYEPTLHIGLDEDSLGGGVFASADAARVGGGLYRSLVEALCTLALDPNPLVRDRGIKALLAAQVELIPLGVSRHAGAANSSASSANPTPSNASSPAVMSSFLPKSWQAKSWRSFTSPRMSQTATSVGADNTSNISSTPPNILPQSASIPPALPYVLRLLPDNGQFDSTVRRGNIRFNHSQPNDIESCFYDLCCREHRHPSLHPLRVEEPIAPWIRSPSRQAVDKRKRQRSNAILRCSLVKSNNVRLRDQVHAVDVGANETTALMLEPFRPLIVAADGQGCVRIADYRNSVIVNQFSLGSLYKSSGIVPQIRSLFRINDFYNEVLLVCGLDGVVSVWRNYTENGQESLATAWRAILNPLPNNSPQATFCYSSDSMPDCLFAAGEFDVQRQGTVNIWNLEYETCGLQLRSKEDVSIQYLACAKRSPMLFAGSKEGCITIFDIRVKKQVGEIKYGSSNLIGIVSEPGEIENQFIAGYREGHINFMDIRKCSDDGNLTGNTWKRIEAHSKGNVTNLCGHSHAPILASATASQVVKVWSAHAEQVGVVRTKPNMLSSGPLGATSCLTFSEYDLELGSGGRESVCAVYHLDVIS